ncbi:lipid kinase [Vitiosangium sp. GDMCC 1.1324]|uniref:lipid kinase n=1 Tax=Vitiosangium sp. (strain GDMCC 1.1324) TaxID=2138576 RepID=UPI000D344D6C|nr:lipid kinase [Vitiosangium sp. GDMCC 1.1324]PTL83490.1 lipid kinase [Vitiosangium sp. GDMCC 1.1324]
MASEASPDVALTAPPKRSSLDDGPALLVVNTRCRMGRESFPATLAALEARGIPLVGCHRLSRQKRMDQVLHDALESGVRRILIGGGDGTLNAAVQHLLGRDVTLGVLPLGTGNDFARSLGIPPSVEAACDIIASGYTARVDVGLANGRPFLNAVSLGLASAIARRLTPRFKRRAGKLAYPVAAVAELWEHQPFHVRMATERGEMEQEVLHLVVGNGRYHGAGNMVTPDATLDDHRLDAYTVAAPSAESGREGTGLGHVQDLSTLARVALSLRRGEHVTHPAVTAIRSSHLYVDAQPPQDVNADGEIIGHTPVRFELAPAALRVYAPAPAPH